MSQRSGWLDGLPDVRRVLKEAHTNRHRTGRDATKLRKAEIERLRESGEEARATRLEEIASKKSTQFMRLKRQAEEREAERELKKLGAVLRREDRKAFKRQPPDKMFIQFEAQARAKDGRLRDLYYDWIGRGLGSGKKRDYARAKKRTSSRTTPWKSGEMGRKIRYIFRDSALEEVEGNALTNMGDDIVEAVACSRLLEDLERLGRSKNGGVYHHVILALPHQLSGRERAGLLNELTQPLLKMQLPFCAALHKPDARGDDRNFHVHLVVSLRSFERIGEYEWQFSPSKKTWLNTPAGIKLQRKFVARSFNRALTRARSEARWTHKSRKDRGEQNPGNTKKGPERTRQERDEQLAKNAYLDARKLMVELAADERAAANLDQADKSFEASGLVLRACIEDAIAESRDVAEQSAAALQRLEATGAALSRLVRDQGRERSRQNAPPAKVEEAASATPNEAPTPAEQVPPSSEMDPDERAKKRRELLERAVHGDKRGFAYMSTAVGEEPPVEAFQRMREAVRTGGIRRVKSGRLQLDAVARLPLCEDLDACLSTEKGKAYLWNAIPFLPPAPSSLEGWVFARLPPQAEFKGVPGQIINPTGNPQQSGPAIDEPGLDWKPASKDDLGR